MAAFANRSLPQRGPAAGLRFFIYALLALTLMILDQRGGWLERVRYGLQAAAYPLQLAMNSPSAAWNWTREIFEARASLQEENARLRESNRLLRLANMRQAALEQENAQLRGLRTRLPALAAKWLPGEVIGTESTTLRQRITVNRGAANGVFKGQAVIANAGLLGQTLRVGPWSTEVILVTDPEHAVPVQVVRNGLRTLAIGSGDPDTLTLPYLPIQSDIKEGDLLVTSGLGGVFPQGYPVARIAQVRRDGSSPLAQVRATPLAAIERDRVVSFLWFDGAHPAAPALPATAATGGDPTLKPMTATVPPPPVRLPAVPAPPASGAPAPRRAPAAASAVAAQTPGAAGAAPATGAAPAAAVADPAASRAATPAASGAAPRPAVAPTAGPTPASGPAAPPTPAAAQPAAPPRASVEAAPGAAPEAAPATGAAPPPASTTPAEARP